MLNEQPLSDIRVLDLGGNISSSYCASLLADYGADVIKVEPPSIGDPVRSLGPFPSDMPDLEKSGLFIHLNNNKRGITLDMSNSDARDVINRLTRTADIIVEGHKPGHLSALGSGYSDLKEMNDALVYTSVTPFGQTGDYRDYRATDMGIFAMSGRMYAHGLPGQMPLAYGPGVIWYQVGTTAAVATMGALLGSRMSGIGRHVDISAMEAVTGNVDTRILFYEYTKVKTSRDRWPGGVPQGAYPCSDGYVVFGVGYDRYFKRLCAAIGRPDIYEDPRWSTANARSANSEEFEAILIEWMMEHTKYEVFRICQSYRVMCAPLLSFKDLVDDPQLVARNYFVQVIHPKVGSFIEPGPPFKMIGNPVGVKEPAPLLGQHNVDIFHRELGYSRADLTRLQNAGII